MATWDSQRVVPRPIALASLGNLLQMQILAPTPDPLSQELWLWGSGICVLMSFLSDPGAL